MLMLMLVLLIILLLSLVPVLLLGVMVMVVVVVGFHGVYNEECSCIETWLTCVDGLRGELADGREGCVNGETLAETRRQLLLLLGSHKDRYGKRGHERKE